MKILGFMCEEKLPCESRIERNDGFDVLIIMKENHIPHNFCIFQVEHIKATM